MDTGGSAGNAVNGTSINVGSLVRQVDIYIYIRITHLVWDRIVEIFPETRFLTSCAQAMYPTTILPTLEHASVLVFVSGHRFLDGSPTKRRGGTPSISCLRCDPRRRFSVGAIRSFEEINERNYFIKYFIVLKLIIIEGEFW